MPTSSLPVASPVRRLACALLGVLLLAAVAPAQVPVGDSPEEWMLLSLDGQPAGYLHSVIGDTPDGLVSTWLETRMKLARMGTSLTVTIESTTLETADGAVVRMTSRTALPGESVTQGVVEDGTLHLTVLDQSGQERRFDQPWDPECLGPAWWARRTAEWLAEAQVGDELTMKAYEMSLGQAIETNQRVLSIEPDGIVLEGSLDILPGVKQTERLSPDGELLSFSTSIAGLEMAASVTTRDAALAAYEKGGLAPEAFEQTIFRPDVPLPRPRSLDRVIYRLKAKNRAIPFPDFASRRQTVLERSPGELLLEVRRVLPGEARPDADPGPEYLEPNATIQSDDPEVAALAERLAGDASDPWDVARRLERGVYEYIDKKSLGVAFGTASEVCRQRTGDCTEHAVLLAALCRARGVPSRVSMGVLYLGGIFGGHAWTEAWIDGDWIALDGTLGLGSVDAAHIRFGTSSLAGVGLGAEMFGALSGLANLEVQIVETEHDGRVRRPAEGDATSLSVDGDTVTSHDYGFSLTTPEGFTWDPETPDWTTGLVARAKADDGRTLSVRARAVGYAFGPDDLPGLLGAEGEEADGAIPVRVDGRSGLVGDFHGWVLGVLDGDTVFEVRLQASDDEEALQDLVAIAHGLTFTG